jgi:hypothetical protein
MNRVWSRCPRCDQLIRVIPGAHKGDSRQRDWWPLDHSDEQGKPCKGSERAI